jgi:hypothetical protein
MRWPRVGAAGEQSDQKLAQQKSTIRFKIIVRAIHFPLAGLSPRYHLIYAVDCAECETKSGMIDHIKCVVTLEGDLNDEQLGRLLGIAGKCPTHRTLKSEVDIREVEGRVSKGCRPATKSEREIYDVGTH